MGKGAINGKMKVDIKGNGPKIKCMGSESMSLHKEKLLKDFLKKTILLVFLDNLQFWNFRILEKMLGKMEYFILLRNLLINICMSDTQPLELMIAKRVQPKNIGN